MDAGGVRTVYVRLLRSQLAVEESPRCRLNGAKRSLILSRKSQFFRVESLPELSVSRFHPARGRAVLIISAGLLVQVALVKEEGNNMRNS